MPNDENRIALVTGAGHGIGQGIAERLAADGYSLVLLDIDGRRCETVAKKLGDVQGVETLALTGDAGSEQDVKRAMGHVA